MVSASIFPAAFAAALAFAVVLAWAWDAWLGEPRNRLHPVAWFGAAMAPLGRSLTGLGPAAAFAGGALAWLAAAVVLGSAAWLWTRWVVDAPTLVAAAAIALWLKPCFAWRMLHDEVRAVDDALARSLDAGRAQVARLVSRDVGAFNAGQVREAALSTLAENLNDSLVAPLFWFVLFGLPGAVIYRMANTLDAMWGYRNRYAWAGKFAARADDVLSWVPARLTALLLLGTVKLAVWRRLAATAALTPSPNGGWPMGALALALDVQLSKPGVYLLNAAGRPPGTADVAKALQRARRAALLAALLAVAVLLAQAGLA